MTIRVMTIAAVFILTALLQVYAEEGSTKSGSTARDAGTVDATTIEGEIPLPQVWFFSSRERIDQPDRHHIAYLKTMNQLCSGIESPLRIHLAPSELVNREEM